MSFLDYAPAPESTAVLNLKKSYGLFIGGEFVDGSGSAFPTVSPSTEEVITTVAEANQAEVDRAVAAARKAYDKTWSRMSGGERGKYLFRIARILQERARELAVAETLDNGKPIRETRDVDIPLVAAWFFYYAGWADKLEYAGAGPNPKALGVAAQARQGRARKNVRVGVASGCRGAGAPSASHRRRVLEDRRRHRDVGLPDPAVAHQRAVAEPWHAEHGADRRL